MDGTSFPDNWLLDKALRTDTQHGLECSAGVRLATQARLDSNRQEAQPVAAGRRMHAGLQVRQSRKCGRPVGWKSPCQLVER